MSQDKLPQAPRCFDVAGKIFLLGEYAVLAGLPACVLAVGPRFQLKSREGTDPRSSVASFHPESPAGRLLAAAPRGAWETLSLEFHDPLQGAGGLGASTAQFLLVYRALASELGWSLEWRQVWNRYRELTQSGSKLPPSGADLVAQWQGGASFFDPARIIHEDLTTRLDSRSFLIFLATRQPGRKVATHSHLEELAQEGFPARDSRLARALEAPLAQGLNCLRNRDLPGLGKALNHYADALSQAGLEIEATAQDRQALASLPGVLGVKGTGALQADALVLLMDPAESDARRSQVIEAAQARGLQLLADGYKIQAGVQSCPV